MSKRIIQYFELNTVLTYSLTDNLLSIIDKGKKTKGWGENSVIEIETTKIFTKTIPVTELEYNNQFDTGNLFDLPTYYNYGVGSAGINCWRELLMHLKTTNWVLNGEIDNFPLLYHYRIIKRKPKESKWKPNELNDYIKRWNNNENIKKYMIARDNAPYEIIFFLEFIPDVLHKWLSTDGNKIELYMKQITDTILFLQKNKIIHFDSHNGNILTDGKTIYLTDFGLVLDEEFNLTKGEKEFFDNNKYYDFGLSYKQIVGPIMMNITNMSNKKNLEYFETTYHFNNKLNSAETNKILFDNLDAICDYLHIDKIYRTYLFKLKDIIMLFTIFMHNIRYNNKKDDVFPNDELNKLLSFKQKAGYSRHMQRGGVAKMILLDGASSSGKSTIAKFYEGIGYTHIAGDDFGKNARKIVYSEVPNEYIDIHDKINSIRKKLMVNESKKHDKVVFDDIDQKIIKYIDKNKLYIIIIYASLSDLVRNLKDRQLTDPRGLFVFHQYAKRYTKTDNSTNNLDTVNRTLFIDLLKQNLKYEFESEQKLIEFVTEIFAKMNIDDDNDHYIKLKDGYQYNYIIKTSGKTKEEIFNELKKLTDAYE